MKTSHKAILIGTLAFVFGCGKNPATQSTTPSAAVTLSSQLEEYATTTGGSSRGAVSDSNNSQVKNVALSTLNAIYGANANVNRVVVGGFGSQYVQPSGNGAFPVVQKSAVYDKDANGKFQLTAGNPVQISAIPFSAMYVFLAGGIIPVAAGGAGFCAGTKGGQTYQTGAAALGLGLSSTSGAPYFIAGFIFRSQGQIQACSLSGCTSVTSIPPSLAKLFPVCDNLMK